MPLTMARCVPYRVIAAYSITPAGRLVPATVIRPRTVTGLLPGDGIEVVEQIPHAGQTKALFAPDGYRPRTASAASRVVYGIPDRPHDPAAAADWDRAWNHPLHSTPSLGCSLTGVHNGPAVGVSPAP